MPPRIDAMLDQRLGHRPGLIKLIRYGAASAAGVVTGQTVLIGLFAGLGVDAAVSNVIAVTVGAIPNYLINRAWTFGKRGRHSFAREVAPFWLMAFLGLALSTVTVAWADHRYDGNVLAVSGANIGAFGVLWIAKFFVLERLLFATPAPQE